MSPFEAEADDDGSGQITPQPLLTRNQQENMVLTSEALEKSKVDPIQFVANIIIICTQPFLLVLFSMNLYVLLKISKAFDNLQKPKKETNC